MDFNFILTLVLIVLGVLLFGCLLFLYFRGFTVSSIFVFILGAMISCYVINHGDYMMVNNMANDETLSIIKGILYLYMILAPSVMIYFHFKKRED